MFLRQEESAEIFRPPPPSESRKAAAGRSSLPIARSHCAQRAGGCQLVLAVFSGMDFFACCSSSRIDKDAAEAFAGQPVMEPDPGAQQCPKLCGLGIAFKPDKRGNLFVKRLIPGGPADLSKLIEVPPPSRDSAAARKATSAARRCEHARLLTVGSLLQTGDVLHAVDGKNVIGMNKMEVANLLMGPAGSKVRLRFLRQEGTGSCYKGAWLACDYFCVLFVCVLLCWDEAVPLMDSLARPLRVLSPPPAVSASWICQCASGVFGRCLCLTTTPSLCRLYASERALRGCMMHGGQACAGDGARDATYMGGSTITVRAKAGA